MLIEISRRKRERPFTVTATLSLRLLNFFLKKKIAEKIAVMFFHLKESSNRIFYQDWRHLR